MIFRKSFGGKRRRWELTFHAGRGGHGDEDHRYLSIQIALWVIHFEIWGMYDDEMGWSLAFEVLSL